jgi:4a-hydroxytetrahydrobiopterin dehydratase
MSRPRPLADSELQTALRSLPGWTLTDRRLRREFVFADFAEAFAFMTRVALFAERMDHHPDWHNVYRTVRIALWTHDAGGITSLDLDLARQISDAA